MDNNSFFSRDELSGQNFQRRCFIASSMNNQLLVRDLATKLINYGFLVYDFSRNQQLQNLLPSQDNMTEVIATAKQTADADLTMLNSLGTLDYFIVILPAGFSAGWELGFATARGARTIVITNSTDIQDIPILHASQIVESISDALSEIRKAV